MNEKVNVKLSAPWDIYFRKLEALFGKDPQIRIEYDREDIAIKLYVESIDKANALEVLLPKEKVFGNVTLTVTVIPANKPTDIPNAVEAAFKGNPIYMGTRSYQINGATFSYALFTDKAAHYYSDDISEYNGKTAALYNSIAKDVIGPVENINFSVIDAPYSNTTFAF